MNPLTALPFAKVPDPEQLTEDKVFMKYYITTKREHPDWTEDQIHEHCFEYQRRGLFKDEEHLEGVRADIKRQMNELNGIVSLTTERNNFLMWSHYSRSHSGFVVGFDKYALFNQAQGALGPVTYQDDLPLIDLFEVPQIMFQKLLSTKSRVWDYENEYRLRKSNFARRTLVLEPETFSEIIFGCQMSFKRKQALMKLISSNFPQAKVYETSLHDGKFELETYQIR